MTKLRHAYLLPVYFYQKCISPFKPATCRFHPTCSVYFIQAVTKHGIFKGSWLGFFRILRCHPFHPGGLDPVPGCQNHDPITQNPIPNSSPDTDKPEQDLL